MPKSSKTTRVKRNKTQPLVVSFELEWDDADVEAYQENERKRAETHRQAVELAKNIDQPLPEPLATTFTIKDEHGADLTYPFADFRVEAEDDDDGSEKVTVATFNFRARPQVPGVVLLDLMASGAEENQAYGAAAIRTFLDRAIDKRDRDRFEAVVASDIGPPVEMESLNGTIQFLIEKYGNRPTELPAS